MIQGANVYIGRSGKTVVVATQLQNEDGVRYEEEKPTLLVEPFNAQQLGQSVARALGATRVKEKSLRDAKPTDWPAFKASKTPSVRRFEQEYVHINVRGANDANITVIVEGSPEKDAELQVTTSVNPMLTRELGEKVLLVFVACRDRRV